MSLFNRKKLSANQKYINCFVATIIFYVYTLAVISDTKLGFWLVFIGLVGTQISCYYLGKYSEITKINFTKKLTEGQSEKQRKDWFL